MAFGQHLWSQLERVRPQFPCEYMDLIWRNCQGRLLCPLTICCLHGDITAQWHILHPGRLKHKPLTKLGKTPKLSAFYPSPVEVCKWRMSIIRKWIIKVILPCPHTKHITLMVQLRVAL